MDGSRARTSVVRKGIQQQAQTFVREKAAGIFVQLDFCLSETVRCSSVLALHQLTALLHDKSSGVFHVLLF